MDTNQDGFGIIRKGSEVLQIPPRGPNTGRLVAGPVGNKLKIYQATGAYFVFKPIFFYMSC